VLRSASDNLEIKEVNKNFQKNRHHIGRHISQIRCLQGLTKYMSYPGKFILKSKMVDQGHALRNWVGESRERRIACMEEACEKESSKK
jgi:hypothetical protein